MKYAPLVALVMLFVQVELKAQTSTQAIGMTYLGGNIFMHTPKIHVEQPAYSQALEISYAYQTRGKKQWHQLFGFPEAALNVCLAQNGSSELGWSYGFYPSIRFKAISFKQSYVFWKIGGGIGYSTKHWERTPYQDSVNNILGSAMNNFTMIQMGYRTKITNNLSLEAGVFFHHVSNAAARSPNFGINTYGGLIGLHYHPQGFQFKYAKKEWPTSKQPIQLVSKAAISFSEEKISNGPIYAAYNFTLAGSKMIRHKSRLQLGTDLTYHAKLYALYKNNYLFPGAERRHAIRSSIFLGNEFVFGKIGLPLQLGVYLNRPIQGPKIYQKLGMNYHFYHDNQQIVKDLFLILQLKTHLAQAEYAEVGIGMML